MKDIKRIAIIGNAGSGKSNLSQQLRTILHLPVYHLDQYFWKPGWVEPDRNEYKKIHDGLCEQEQWIIDGMNLSLLEYRVRRAEVIIFLDFPRHVCLCRILKRTLTHYGQEAPTGPKGCPEKFNRAFLKFLKWVWNFKGRYNPKIKEVLQAYSDKKQIYILRSQKEIDQFVKNIV